MTMANKKPIKKNVTTVGSLVSQQKLSADASSSTYTSISGPASSSNYYSTTTSSNPWGPGVYDSSSWTLKDDYGWSLNTEVGIKLDPETLDKILKGIFENETDLIPLVKNYFVKYLDQVMEDPDELIKEVIKEKDDEIKKLKESLDSLNARIDSLTKLVNLLNDELSIHESGGDTKLGPNPWTTSPWTGEITWVGGPDSTSTTTISTTTSGGTSATSLTGYYVESSTNSTTSVNP